MEVQGPNFINGTNISSEMKASRWLEFLSGDTEKTIYAPCGSFFF